MCVFVDMVPHSVMFGCVPGQEALPGRSHVRVADVGQHDAIPHHAHAQLVGAALEPDRHDHVAWCALIKILTSNPRGGRGIR